MADTPPDITNLQLYSMALVLSRAAKDMLRVKGGIRLSAEPEIRERRIVQFGKRMRIDGLEKFSERTVFSSLHFYRDKSDMDKHNAVGCMIVYIPVSYLSRLLHLLDYPRVEEDDEEDLLDGCGTLTNLFGGWFVKELSAQGYVHLEMSHFESYINTAVNGIEFSSDQGSKCEIDFKIRDVKRLVMELTMAPIPHY
ncbi:MAG: hypothetical protein HGA80_03720 [Candidatus Omnitrophica bacterium]|nr:hypothetical protein [Candidatus Omnitrophota bacterium]